MAATIDWKMAGGKKKFVFGIYMVYIPNKQSKKH